MGIYFVCYLIDPWHQNTDLKMFRLFDCPVYESPADRLLEGDISLKIFKICFKVSMNAHLSWQHLTKSPLVNM